jgi:hypothetical protein
MAKVTKKYQGLSANRYKTNPLEKAFAVRWQDWNQRGSGVLPHMLNQSDLFPPPAPTKHDWQVACTIIQWLGSPVGQQFLAEHLSSSPHPWVCPIS